MNQIASYILSSYSFIFSHSLESILSVGYESDDSIPIPSFEESLLIALCSQAQKDFEKECNILLIDGDVIVVGDIHGSLHDLLRIIKFSQGKKSKVLFLGDYVDRGDFSLECITLLFALKILYPDTFYLIRGNHEYDCLCSQYGFKDEIINYHNPKKPKTLLFQSKKLKSEQNKKEEEVDSMYDEFYSNYEDEYCYKYSDALYYAFIKVFSYLPIAAIINNETFCIHGGLSPKLDRVDDLKELIKRPINSFEECQLLTDIVWSDPSYSPSCAYVANTRGRGYLFNNETVNNFLKKNSLKRIVRGHQCVENGVLKDFGDKCITVFSASSYDKLTSNNSGILQIFEQDGKYKVTSFESLPRLPKSEAVYYKVQSLIQNETKRSRCFSLLHPKLFSKTSTSRMLSCKVSSENFFPIHNSQGKVYHLVRPKFTTNRRQSYNSIIKASLMDKTPSNSDNEDAHNEKFKCGSAPQFLSKNLYSFSDINDMSIEEY